MDMTRVKAPGESLCRRKSLTRAIGRRHFVRKLGLCDYAIGRLSDESVDGSSLIATLEPIRKRIQSADLDLIIDLSSKKALGDIDRQLEELVGRTVLIINFGQCRGVSVFPIDDILIRDFDRKCHHATRLCHLRKNSMLV